LDGGILNHILVSRDLKTFIPKLKAPLNKSNISTTTNAAQFSLNIMLIAYVLKPAQNFGLKTVFSRQIFCQISIGLNISGTGKRSALVFNLSPGDRYISFSNLIR
jgi:hypothetical protein